jgi:aminoglycoside phosphotransferase (APT) family kinase protein
MCDSMPELGELLARGRAADVYAYGDRHVLRRYRTDHDNLYEAAVMQHVVASSYPAPEVVEVAGRDLVMERLDGPTMLVDLQKRPWRIRRHTATLAGLLHRLHDLPVPAWAAQRHEGGTQLVHLDLHPDNVMLTSRGPVVIDWTNAGRGDADAEIADLWLVLSTADAPSSGFDRLVVAAGRGLLVGGILKHFDRDAVRHKLRLAFDQRSNDRNMSEIEKARMMRLIERHTL